MLFGYKTIYFTRDHQGNAKVGGHDTMMMERSRCVIEDWKGGHGKRPELGNYWDSNLGDRD